MKWDLEWRLAERREMVQWPYARIEAMMNERLRALVDYAWNDIPFYRKRWEAAGLVPADFQKNADLARFPMVTKEELVAGAADWMRLTRGYAGLCTKGTTGMPLVMWLDREDLEMPHPGVIMGFEQSGMRAGTNVLLLNPAWHRMSGQEVYAARYLGARPVFAAGSVLEPGFADSFLAAIARFRPDYVVAPTPFVLSLLKGLEEQGRNPRDAFAGVRVLMILGLPVTPGLREMMRVKTGVEAVWDRGGSTEGLAMDECPLLHTQHIYEDTVYAEIVDERGVPVPDGTRGVLVFSKLNRSPSPMVRYYSGDVAVMGEGPCACGHSMRRLQLLGRLESGLNVGGKYILAYDVRLCVDADPELVGRNVVLVREAPGWRGVQSQAAQRLQIIVEGDPVNEAPLLSRLHAALGLADVQVLWSGSARLQWSYRQVFDSSELPFLKA